ncbi:MAG: Gldg family protein, partial [Oligoflexales bacterium]|nr:Gldg family protein [Oligoflexales bacterium]
IAQKLADRVSAKFYFSKSVKNVPVNIKAYGTRVEEVLREFAAYSGGKMTLEVIDPKPDTDDEEWAKNYGIKGVPLQTGEDLYMGVVFIAADREEVIPYLDARKEEFLEYDLSSALVKLGSSKKQKLGIMSSLSMTGGFSMPGSPPSEDWAVVTGLKNFYDVEVVSPNEKKIPDSINILLVAHPKNMNDAAQYAIDQFLLRGGRLMVAVDPFSRIDLSINQQAAMQGQFPMVSSYLPKLFNSWGIEFSPTEMAGDSLQATRIRAGTVDLAYPFFITLSEKNFSKGSKITGHLKQMMYTEGGWFSLKEKSEYKLEPLIESSANTGSQNVMVVTFQDPQTLVGGFKTDGKKRTFAGLLKGKFKTAFPEGPPKDSGLNASDQIKEAKEEGAVVLIGDVDFMHDSNSVQIFRLGQQAIIRPQNDNLNFVLNAVEFLGGSGDLISIRSSGQISRPFTKVLEIQRNAQVKWKEEEERLSKELSSLERTLSELQAARTDANRAALTPMQQREIQKFREQEKDIRLRRRLVRKNLREDIESLGYHLIAANLLIVPLGVCVFGLTVLYKREKWSRKEKAHG